MTGCPAGGFIQDSNTFNFNSFYPAGFTPRFFGTTDQFFGAVGYKGTMSNGLSYDVSGTTAQNSLAVSLKTTINPSLGPRSPGKLQRRQVPAEGNELQRGPELPVDGGRACEPDFGRGGA